MTQLEPSAATVNLALENERLREELRARLTELAGCRRRLVDTVYAERRRIERDLHDAAQGRLVSVAMSLGFLEAKLPTDPAAARPIAREAREAVMAALEELRGLSRGLYPAVLTERGLAGALEDLAESSALPTQLELSIESRPPTEVEAAAYFVASEALTNAAKHSAAHGALIAAWREGELLVVELTDDGIGGAAANGSGLRGLAARVEALGGRLVISSPPGRGTYLRAEIPDNVDSVRA